MSQVLAWIKRAIKRGLRPFADALLASSRALPAQVEACLAQSEQVGHQVQRHLADSSTLAHQVEHCLATSKTLALRFEEFLAESPTVAAWVQHTLEHSDILAEPIERCVAQTAVVPRKVDEYLEHSAALGSRLEDHLAISAVLTEQIERHLVFSDGLWNAMEHALRDSQGLPARVEEVVASSTALPELVEHVVATSEVVAARVEESLGYSGILPERVDQCVEASPGLSARIEECFWNSTALAHRIDKYLAGQSSVTDLLLEESFRRSKALPQILTDLLPHNPCLPAVVQPLADEYPVVVPAQASKDSEHPVPPLELWEDYGPSAEDYLASGRQDAKALQEVLGNAGRQMESAGRLLDFSCGAGRVLRALTELAAGREMWGVDYRAPHVHWLRQYLCPPLRALTCSTHPHLPFEDRFFDLIWSTTPFGRPHELADAWLLELKRILRLGGMLYLRVLDRPAVDRLLNPGEAAPRGNESVLRAALSTPQHRELLDSSYASLALATPLGVQIIYCPDSLRTHWGREFRIVSTSPAATGPGTAYLLERT